MDDGGAAADPDQVAAATMANRSLLMTLLVVLEERGVLSRADIDIVTDVALTGVEHARGVDGRIRDIARLMLEETAKNVAAGRKRRAPTA